MIVCRNPLLADERARQREDLLRATEKELDRIGAAARREKRPLRGRERIGLRVGKVLGRYKMAKHFQLTITDDAFTYERRADRIREEAAVDGLYIIRTSVSAADLAAGNVVSAYKRLSTVERAFRSLKSVDLQVRPIHHHLAGRVRAHVFLCMLAYYVEWHMRQALAPLLFDDADPQLAEAGRESPVAPARRSPAAQRKVQTQQTEDGFPVQSFRSLLRSLSTIVKNHVQPLDPAWPAFDQTTRPNPLQQRALDLLQVRI